MPSENLTPAESARAAKTALRDQLATSRNRIPLGEIAEGARATAAHLLATEEVRRAATVTAYVSVGREPGTGVLLDALVAAGKRVLLPLTLPDLDLDWAVYAGPESLVRARFGLLEPATPPLGVDAVAGADAVLVPGSGVSGTGYRIGKGGGCYDRALARVPASTFTCVLLHEGEVGVPVPVEAHDRPVAAACTPRGLTRFVSPPGPRPAGRG